MEIRKILGASTDSCGTLGVTSINSECELPTVTNFFHHKVCLKPFKKFDSNYESVQ